MFLIYDDYFIILYNIRAYTFKVYLYDDDDDDDTLLYALYIYIIILLPHNIIIELKSQQYVYMIHG